MRLRDTGGQNGSISSIKRDILTKKSWWDYRFIKRQFRSKLRSRSNGFSSIPVCRNYKLLADQFVSVPQLSAVFSNRAKLMLGYCVSFRFSGLATPLQLECETLILGEHSYVKFASDSLTLGQSILYSKTSNLLLKNSNFSKADINKIKMCWRTLV
jgi:hypothetical protein